MHYLLGIDPGLDGAIAILNKNGELIEVFDMPTVEVKVGKSMKRRVSPELLTSELRGKWEMVDAAWVEQVASSPQMGVSSAFSFGESYGILKGVLAAMHIPCHTVLPGVWKRDLKLNASKDGSRAKAIQLWPAHAGEFKRVKDDGRAESALIAHWALRNRTG